MFEGAAPAATQPPDLRERLRAALAQPRRQQPVRQEAVTELPDLSRLGGKWFDSPAGPGYVIESLYEVGHEHGRIALHRALSVDSGRLAGQCKDDRLAATHPRDFLYVDTETTGLGGAGAMVFLAGTARFDGSMLKLRQYLQPSPEFEVGLLGGLADDLGRAGALVSYNGKSFDLPVLETRYILSRMRPTFRDLPHLDLLHPNRRLFKGNFDSHKLVRMEQELLGFEREDDCPSAEVPMRYFQFARTSDPTHILPVLRHNAWDILSLVALTAHLAAVCDGDETPFAAARAAEYAGDLESAIAYYAASLDVATARAERLEAIEHAADCCRKLGRHGDAAGWWRRMLAEPRHRRLRPYVELAKILEHQQKDRPAASALIEEAIDLVRRGLTRPGPANSETSLAALEHRAHRLAGRVLSSQVLSSE